MGWAGIFRPVRAVALVAVLAALPLVFAAAPARAGNGISIGGPPAKHHPTTGIVPPSNPRYSLALDERIEPDCTSVSDHSQTCLDESVAMINAGRRQEQLGPLVLPANWSSLTVPEQLFVMTDLERTARGLTADVGLVAGWDADALAGADAATDPSLGGDGSALFGSIWGGGEANPILATVDWVYDDGLFPDGSTKNGDCSAGKASGCWIHRDIELHDQADSPCATNCAVGAAYSPRGFDGSHGSYAEVFGNDAHASGLVFSWASEVRQLPTCEQSGDTCSWEGRPIVVSSGILNVRGVPAGVSPPIKPWFPVRISGGVSRRGSVRLTVSVGSRLPTVVVTAVSGKHQATLRVRRRSAGRFAVRGTLASGRWRIALLYRIPAADGVSPSSVLWVTVAQRGRHAASIG